MSKISIGEVKASHALYRIMKDVRDYGFQKNTPEMKEVARLIEEANGKLFHLLIKLGKEDPEIAKEIKDAEDLCNREFPYFDLRQTAGVLTHQIEKPE